MLSKRQIGLLRDIRMKGAIDALLFSSFRSEGLGLRGSGLIDGIGDSTGISAAGMLALAEADRSITRNVGGQP